MNEAEQQVFPPIPDDQVWCQVRGLFVGTSVCATDACVAPEMRPICWEGQDANGSRYQCPLCGAWNAVTRDRCGNCRKVLK